MTKKLSQKELDKIRKNLVDYLKELEKEMSKVAKKGQKGYSPSFPQYGNDQDDNILEIENFAENISIEEKLSELIESTNRAIAKVDQGSYGICEDCGKKIRTKRLDIFPIATKCVDCSRSN